MPDPVPVIPLEYAKPPEQRSRWAGVTRACLLLAAACCAVGWVVMTAVEVESVLVTGPVLLALGLLLVIGGALTRDGRALSLGAAHCGICILFVALVNLRGWSPTEAKAPFAAMGALHTLATGALTAAAWLPGRLR